MAGESLRNDVAHSTAIQIVELFASLLREEEQRDAFVEVYALVLAGFESIETRQLGAINKIRPSQN